MLAHPTLLKRPLLARGETLIVGFDPARYATLGA
ncbi:arsenate reductase family protein [Salinicola tamaricis]